MLFTFIKFWSSSQIITVLSCKSACLTRFLLCISFCASFRLNAQLSFLDTMFPTPLDPKPQQRGSLHPDKKPELYKTEMCRNWTEMGHCR